MNKELKNEVTLENYYWSFEISYVISDKNIFCNEKDPITTGLDLDVLLFLFSLNHKEIVYKKVNEQTDFKKLRQYVYRKKSESLYLMNSFLVLEKSTSSNQFIQTNNEFLNAIACIFKDFPEDLFDKKMYLQFSQNNNIINSLLKEEPYFREELYLVYLQTFIDSIKK